MGVDQRGRACVNTHGTFYSNCPFPSAVLGWEPLKAWIWWLSQAPAHCYFALYFLQIMIEFCPGGAVDAIMLGEFFAFCFFFLARHAGS